MKTAPESSSRQAHRTKLLTERQSEILRLICEGHLNKEVAQLLQISTRTVDFHRARIMERVGARTASELVRRTIEEGLVASQDSPHAGTFNKPLEDAATLAKSYSIALENSPVVVFSQDRLLRYTWINSPVLNWAEQGYIGRTDMEIVGGAEGERLTKIKQEVLESGIGTRTGAAISFNGETHYFDLTVKPLRDAGGSIEGITCVCADITEARRTFEKAIEEFARTQPEPAKNDTEPKALQLKTGGW
jgi:DNA-binding CsgD family transcriptional regulator